MNTSENRNVFDPWSTGCAMLPWPVTPVMNVRFGVRDADDCGTTSWMDATDQRTNEAVYRAGDGTGGEADGCVCSHRLFHKSGKRAISQTCKGHSRCRANLQSSSALSQTAKRLDSIVRRASGRRRDRLEPNTSHHSASPNAPEQSCSARELVSAMSRIPLELLKPSQKLRTRSCAPCPAPPAPDGDRYDRQCHGCRHSQSDPG